MKIPTIVLLTALVFSNWITADTNQYIFTIDAPEASKFSYGGTYLTGINASGQIIGYYSDNYKDEIVGYFLGKYYKAFVFANGSYTVSASPQAQGINAGGQIVG